MRPVSVGVFGTWGTGKSSLLNLIESQIRREASEKVIVIRFDAWLYQGYDDARAALMEVIARTLYEAAKDDETLLDLAKRLLARVNTLRTLGLGIELVAAFHGLPLLGAASCAVEGVRNIVKGDPSPKDTQAVADGSKEVLKLIDPANAQTPPKEIDAFRQEFGELLEKLAGRPTREVIDALVDAFVPENGDADRIRAALNDALSECLEGVDEFDFGSITDEVLVNLMVTYVSLSVFQAIVLDSDRAFGKGATPAAVENAEKQLMELVKVVSEKHMAPLLAGDVGGISPAQMQAAQIAAIREVWKEWEGYE